MVKSLLILLLGLVTSILSAQAEDEVVNGLMETYAEYAGSSLDYLDLYDQVIAYKRNPINLNKASFQDLSSFVLIGEARANLIIQYRKDYGMFISIYELQAISTFTPEYIKVILPYITVQEQLSRKLWSDLKDGKHELMILSQYSDISHLQPVNPTDSNRVLGDGTRALLRYRYAMPGRYSVGITAEKDAGELWPTSALGRKAGFLSAHVFILPNSRFLHSLAIGDYQVNFGQGLTFSSGLSFGKSALVLNSFRSQEGIRAYRSVNETQFLRGAAIKINLTKTTRLTSFMSKNRENVVIDANGAAGSINNFGYVRTLRDISRKDNQEIGVIGLNLSQQYKTFHVGITTVHQNFSVPFAKSQNPYSVYRLSGSLLNNFGLDYRGNIKNVLLYGEVSGNDFAKQPAMIHGALIAISKHWSANVVYRNFPKDYHSIFSTAWSEQSAPANEKALYLALQYEIYRKWKISAFADIISFPWLRFRDNAPGYQQDYFIEVKQSFSKYLSHYLRVRRTLFTDNFSNKGKLKQQQENERWNLRYHIDKDEPGKVSTALRVEVVQFSNQEKNALGSLMYADLGYRSKKGKLRVVGRYTLFNTTDYDTRIYVYESDVLYAFSIPAMYGNGSRIYMVITAKPFKNFTFWAKLTFEKNERKTTLDQLNFNPLGRLQIRYTW